MARLPRTPLDPGVIHSLFRLWREAKSRELRRFAAWAFSEQPLLSRDAFAPDVWSDCDTWFEQSAIAENARAALILAWYRRRPWSDPELAGKVSKEHGLAPPAASCWPRSARPDVANDNLRILPQPQQPGLIDPPPVVRFLTPPLGFGQESA